ncbi:MAG: ATP-binding protein [Planctomycetota bacterium]
MLESAVIESDFMQAKQLQQKILSEIDKYDYDQCAVFAIRLAMEEALNNAIRHGNAGDPSKKVEVEYEVSPEKVMIQITDEGVGFIPEKVPDPTADENLEKPSGRGIMLIHAYMDEVEYLKRGNCVRMVKLNQ